MNTNRDTLFEYFKQNNGKLESETWSQVENRFGIGSGTGDAARKLWYRYRKQLEAYDSLVLKSRWQVQTKGGGTQWLESYRSNLTPEDIMSFREELIADMKKGVAVFPEENLKLNLPKTNNLLEISLPDIHIGRESFSSIRLKVIGTLNTLIARTCQNVDSVVFIVGNDLFNSDNTNYQTTRGTQQFDVNDWKDTFIQGKNLMMECINILLRAFNCPIHVIIVPGNHDTSRIFYLGDVLDAYYHNHPRVHVDNSLDRFKFVHWGSNLIMYDHGEIKPEEYPLIMATERPDLWSRTKYREVHTGHLHHQIVKCYRGVKVRFLPSLASHSDWEKSKGFGGNPEAMSFVWNKDDGLISINLVNL
jgi:hypothetical protein